MADITAAEINTQLGVAAFDDNSGAGPLTLDLDVLTGDPLTLASGVAEPLFKALKAASETAAAKGENVDTYPAITRTIQTINGEPKARYGGSIVVSAPLDYSAVSTLS